MPELTGREKHRIASELTMKSKLIPLRLNELLDGVFHSRTPTFS
jgi:hypothetical protein